MNAPELESRLSRFAPRRLPAAWKAEILAVANARAPQPQRGVFFGVERWAWGAVAAAWLVIFALRATTPALPPPSGPAMSMAELERHWREVRRYAAMDLLPPEPPTPVRIQIEQEFVLPAHRPRS
jgi:hypothetical protein